VRALAAENQFELLVLTAEKYGKALGIGRDFFMTIYREKWDWAFIIQIDALNETASREALSRLLRVNGKEPEDSDTPADFVQSLNYQGRTSIIRLLKLAGVPKETTEFVEHIRIVRNAYAHDIRALKTPMLEIIKHRSEKSKMLRRFSFIEQYDEAGFLNIVEKDPSFLRFLILNQAMLFLYGLHQNFGRRRPIKPKVQRTG
jgi:hypothetical protein